MVWSLVGVDCTLVGVACSLVGGASLLVGEGSLPAGTVSAGTSDDVGVTFSVRALERKREEYYCICSIIVRHS